MKVTEPRRAPQNTRTTIPRVDRLLIAILLLLPIGIGIGIRQSRSVSSGANEQSRREPPVAPIRKEQGEVPTSDVAGTAEKATGDQAARAVSTDKHRSELKDQGPVLGDGAGRALLSSTAFLSPGDSIAISKITPSLVPSPTYKLRTGPEKVFVPRNWLEMEVEFSVRKPVPGGAVFRFEVQMNGTVFTGDIAVAPLEKGDGLFTVGYISPGSLQRAFHGRELNFDSGLRVDIAVVSKGEKIGGAISKTKVTEPAEQKLEQTILSKADTPFAPLFWDRYVEAAVAPSSEIAGSTR